MTFFNFKHENFYTPLESNSSSDLYIGKNAGKQILEKIDSAKISITIVSPYISEEKLDLLLLAQKKGITVKLMFNNLTEVQSKRENIVHKLVCQTKNTDTQKVIEKAKAIKRKKITLLSLFITGLLLFFSSSYFITQRVNINLNLALFITSIFLFLLTTQINTQITKLKKSKIYSYNYHKNIDFRYINSPKESILHSKIYIIDEKIAYLGSLNFTNSGFKNHIETRIKISDLKTVLDISKYTDYTFETTDYSSENNISSIIKMHFKEVYF